MNYRGRRLSASVLKTLLIILPVFLLFSVIWLRSNLVAIEYDMGQLQLQKARLINDRRELAVKRAELASAKKVEYIAADSMGLKYPNRRRVVYLKRGRETGAYTAGLSR